MSEPLTPPLDCSTAEGMISARIDGQLDDAGSTALDDHLEQCSDCRETVQAWSQQHESLGRALSDRSAAAAVVAQRVIGQMQTRPAARPVRAAWWPLLVAAAAGFLLAVTIWRPWHERAHVVIPPVAQLGLGIGRIEVQRPGSNTWEVAVAGAGLEAGSVVRTGPSDRCELLTSDGALVWMHGDTQVQLRDKNAVQLASGQVFTCPTPRSPLTVHASDTKVEATDGQFDLVCQPDRKEVVLTAVRGQTDVQGKGAKQSVVGGQSVKIVDGSIVERRQVVDLIAATNWIHEILAQKGEDDPELTARVDAMMASLGRAKMSMLYEDEIRAMGAGCAVPLARYIESIPADQQAERRRNAARILADIAPTSSVADLVGLLDDTDGEVRAQAARGLTRLTGQDHGLPADQWSSPWAACEPTHERWLKWWEANKTRYGHRR